MYFLNTAKIISLNNYHEKYSVHRCRNSGYWLVAGRFCLQRHRAHPHFIGIGRSLNIIIAHQKGRMMIIIIDDDQDFCMLFQQLLQKRKPITKDQPDNYFNYLKTV
jgi:hypothetical protein